DVVPATRLQAPFRFDPQGVVQPALNEVELELTSGKLERVTTTAVAVLGARNDGALAVARQNPCREREFVVETKVPDVAHVHESLAIEVGSPANTARDVADGAALDLPRLSVARRVHRIAVEGIAGKESLREGPAHGWRTWQPLFPLRLDTIGFRPQALPRPLRRPKLVVEMAQLFLLG